MKRIMPHLFLFSCIVFLHALLMDRFPLTSFVLCTAFAIYRCRDKTGIVLVILLLVQRIPVYKEDMPAITTGRVIDTKESYAIVEEDGYKLLIYTDALLPYHAIVHFDGTREVIQSSHSFYGGSFSSWCARQGIFYSLDPDYVSVEEEGSGIRNYLKESCEQIEDTLQRTFALRLLCGIGSKDALDSFLFVHGFSLSAVLALIETILRYFLDRKPRTIIMTGFYILGLIVYDFPLVIFTTMTFRLLSLTSLPSDQRMGIVFLLTLFLFPEAPWSASFLIPAAYRITARFFQARKSCTALTSMVVQNILFSSINPIMTFFYMPLRTVTGIAWCCTLLSVVFDMPVLFSLISLMDTMFSFVDKFEFHSSFLGAGLLFFLPFCMCFIHKKNASVILCAILLVFQYTGLFHPFAEVTFINVGQGDSILIRAPFNTGNILIDTGKPSAYSKVETMLDAKGIRRLDALIITHADDDHSGNRDALIDKYDPSLVIEEHHEPVEIAGFMFYDINPVKNEDENSSSLCEYVRINGLDYLFTGDIDETAETEILSCYGNLKADILKLAHHGSKTSSSEDFLDTTKPDLAIISAGSYDYYRHPSPDVIQRLLKRHIPYFLTREEGDMTILCVSRWNLFITSSAKAALIPA